MKTSVPVNPFKIPSVSLNLRSNVERIYLFLLLLLLRILISQFYSQYLSAIAKVVCASVDHPNFRLTVIKSKSIDCLLWMVNEVKSKEITCARIIILYGEKFSRGESLAFSRFLAISAKVCTREKD